MAEQIFLNKALNRKQRVPQGIDAEKLAYLKGIQLAVTDADDIEPAPNQALTDQDFDELEQILTLLQTRQRDPVPAEIHLARINLELDYFDRTHNLKFLISVKHLIDKFKADGVLWGVGRGSSCASYVFYLLEVHDINPIRYDIPFSEFSKEI